MTAAEVITQIKEIYNGLVYKRSLTREESMMLDLISQCDQPKPKKGKKDDNDHSEDQESSAG